MLQVCCKNFKYSNLISENQLPNHWSDYVAKFDDVTVENFNLLSYVKNPLLIKSIEKTSEIGYIVYLKSVKNNKKIYR